MGGRKRRLFKVSALCVGLLVSLGVFTNNDSKATLIGYNGTDVSLGNNYYCAAYEYYGDGSQDVVIGNHAEGESPVIIKKQLRANYGNGTTAVLRLRGARFLNPAQYGSDYTQYCLVTDDNTVVAATGLGLSYPTDTLPFKFNQDVNNGTIVTLAVCNNNATESTNSTMLILNRGFNVNCNSEAFVTVEWDAPFDCLSTTLLSIRPKHIVSTSWDLTAELNAEDDFRTFLYWDPRDPGSFQGATTRLGCFAWTDYARPYCLNFGRDVNATGSSWVGDNATIPISLENTTLRGFDRENDANCIGWVLGNNYVATRDAILSFSFDVVSLNEQPQDGIEVRLVMRGPQNQNVRTYTCQRNDATTWTCRTDCVPCPSCSEQFGRDELQVVLSGNSSKSPTLWSIRNFRIDRVCTDAKVKAACCSVMEGPIGFWYGGVEAIVPFVRHGSGYYTTIKFSSRYHNPVRVYAIAMIPPQLQSYPYAHNMTNFNAERAPWMLKPVIQVGEMTPQNPVITISGGDLLDRLGVPENLRNQGISVKFVFGVPNLETCGVNTTNSYTSQPSGQSVGTLICPVNFTDPFIQGYAVYDTPQGTRRIPIKFKYFKQGGYSE